MSSREIDLLKEIGIGFWTFEGGQHPSFRFKLKPKASEEYGGFERVHPEDKPALLQHLNPASNLKSNHITGLFRLLVNGKWNWYQYRFRFSAKTNTQQGILIPFDEDKKREEDLIEFASKKEKIYRTLGHDLKGQFSSLLGFSDLLADNFHDLDDEMRIKYIHLMRVLTANTFLLVENMFNWAKLQQLQIKPMMVHQMISEKVEEVLGYLLYPMQAKGIKVKNLGNLRACVEADSLMLTSCLLNILTNSIKFSPPNSEIQLKVTENAGIVQLTILDKGVGMTIDQLNSLFNPSELRTTKGTGNESGSGLGMKITKEFVELMNGKISIVSKPGKGTKINIQLPAAKTINF
jgi:signal transduction histidine kinase